MTIQGPFQPGLFHDSMIYMPMSQNMLGSLFS